MKNKKLSRYAGMVAIGALQDAMATLHGHAGTTISTSIDRIEWYER